MAQPLSGELVSLMSFFPWRLPHYFFLPEKRKLANMAAYCHQLSRRPGKLPGAWVRSLEPSCLRCLPVSSARYWGGARHTPLCLLEASRASRHWGFASRPRQPATSRPPPCHWQGPVSKNSPGGDSSLGLKEGDESGEGCQLHFQTRRGGGGAGNPMEARPTAKGAAQGRSAAQEGGGQGCA